MDGLVTGLDIRVWGVPVSGLGLSHEKEGISESLCLECLGMPFSVSVALQCFIDKFQTL